MCVFDMVCFCSSKICNSALSTTAPVVEENQTFDADKGATLVKELRNVFSSGRTKSYVWRISQLKSIAKMLEEKEKEITDAIYKDLSKPYLEAFISEVSSPFDYFSSLTLTFLDYLRFRRFLNALHEIIFRDKNTFKFLAIKLEALLESRASHLSTYF